MMEHPVCGGDKNKTTMEEAGSVGDTARGPELAAPSHLLANGSGWQEHQRNGSRQPVLPGDA